MEISRQKQVVIKNVDVLLDWLQVTRAGASTGALYRPGQLTDLLGRNGSLTDTSLEKIADIFGITVSQLLDPELDTDELFAPDWWQG